MSKQKAMVEKFYHEMWNKADKSHIPDIFHEGFAFRGSLGPVLVGHDQFAGYVDSVVGTIEGFTCDILEMTEEEGRVCAKMLFHGIHHSEMMGYLPTGKRVEWHGSAHFTFDGDKVSDLWVLGDVHGLLQQFEANRAG